MLKEATRSWSPADAAGWYEMPRWSKGYFSISSEGHVLVHPWRDPERAIDLKQLVDRIQLRGISLPVLIRFNGILEDRLRQLHDAFQAAIDRHRYGGGYACVYPIKVNQQRQVVEKIVEYGRRYGFGLEAGSKPELLAVVAMTDPEAPIICNGFKDSEFIEMAMLAQKIGRRVIPVVERFGELELILRHAAGVGVRPQIGFRVKLAAQGSGRWVSSGGHRSKFGLSVSELLAALALLERRAMGDCFRLLHFHVGSQITDLGRLDEAVTEAARIYAELARRGARLTHLDVGGGLGVDYDGSQTNTECSANYTLAQYADLIVRRTGRVCDEAGAPHPTILTESGRAVAAYHSVLVFSVLGVSGAANGWRERDRPAADAAAPVRRLHAIQEELTAGRGDPLDSYEAARGALAQAIQLFRDGRLPLDQRSDAERLFWAVCRAISRRLELLEIGTRELAELDFLLSDTYFCNFSLFQSIPDSWAIDQLFPIMPIHRLTERPVRRAVLGDITCDSDGTIDRFINHADGRRTLLLHPFDGSPYYLGAFLVGAYQEILGDLHNLFGDTNAVHVSLGEDGEPSFETIIKGDTVSRVLHYVQFDEQDLVHRLQTAVEQAVRRNRLNHIEAGRFLKFYEAGLHGYTYLEEPHDSR